jgi:hypothetical protein
VASLASEYRGTPPRSFWHLITSFWPPGAGEKAVAMALSLDLRLERNVRREIHISLWRGFVLASANFHRFACVRREGRVQ